MSIPGIPLFRVILDFALFSLVAPAALAGPQAVATDRSKVAFYFAAHEDDWQLFMNPQAYHDVRTPGLKVVFVHVTAGDKGLGTKPAAGRKQPLYLARENAARLAIQFMADVDKSPHQQLADMTLVKRHSVLRVEYRNTVAYFLRLPDGNGGNGTGYGKNGHQSLARLRSGDLSRLAAIDGSTTYRSWYDLVSTVRAIIDAERGASPQVWIHTVETDQVENPGDHPDHLATAELALESAKNLECANRVRYITYASAGLPENLNGGDRDAEVATFAVTAAGLLRFGYFSAWDVAHLSWLGRSYSSVESGTGSCGPEGMEASISK